MSSRRRVCATVIAAAALLVCIRRAACVPGWANDDDPHAMLFFRSRHLAQWSFRPWRVPVREVGARSGWAALKILFSGGLYRYDAKNLRGQQVVGAEGLAHVLGGWRVKRGDAEFKFFFGPEFQKHHLQPDDPSNRLRGNFLGLSTSNSARVAYGWRVFEEMLGGV